MTDRVAAAAACYVARKHRQNHPAGRFISKMIDDLPEKFWKIDPKEKRDCCAKARPPNTSRFEKFHGHWLNTHCRSATHVANLFGVDVKEMLKVARRLETPATEFDPNLPLFI